MRKFPSKRLVNKDLRQAGKPQSYRVVRLNLAAEVCESVAGWFCGPPVG